MNTLEKLTDARARSQGSLVKRDTADWIFLALAVLFFVAAAAVALR
jgi:hypothetical protein